MLAVAGLLVGCGASFGFAGDETPLTGRSKNLHPVPFSAAWRTPLVPGGIALETGRQLASAAYDPASNRVWIGAADRPWFHAFRASDGHLLWRTALPGGSSGKAIFSGGRVIVGTDGGEVVAFDGPTGEVQWRYSVQGSVVEAPTLTRSGLALCVDGSNAIYALDAQSGTWRWQYRREAPGRFALFGESTPTSGNGRVHVGFSDGILVTLSERDGAVLWTRDLAPEAEQFEDVDASPVLIDGRLYAASVAGGLYALDAASGDVLWTRPVRGIVAMTRVGDDLVVGLDKGDLMRVDPQAGKARWRVGFAEHEGPVTSIERMGNTLVVGLGTGGMHLVDARSGRPLWRFAPGSGFMARPTVGRDGALFALSNAGDFYAFRPGGSEPPLPPVNPLATGTGRGVP